jgi:hypothetical protein
MICGIFRIIYYLSIHAERQPRIFPQGCETFTARLCFRLQQDIEIQNHFDQRRNTMNMSTIADWCTILFLLWFGLKTFIPALEKGFFSTLGGILALAAAVATILDRSA